jgi:hypothetical protein
LSWQVYSGFPLPLTPSRQGREKLFFGCSLSIDGRKYEQASSEDLFPLGYGEWESLDSYSLSLDGRGIG